MWIKDVRRYARAIDVLSRKLKKDPENEKLLFGLKRCSIKLTALLKEEVYPF